MIRPGPESCTSESRQSPTIAFSGGISALGKFLEGEGFVNMRSKLNTDLVINGQKADARKASELSGQTNNIISDVK